MPEIIDRGAWDTSPDRRRFTRALQPGRVKGVVLHYPGDGNHTRAGLTAKGVGVLLRAYQRHHRTFRGWPDIGYCLAVDQSGRIYHLAGPKVAAHSATTVYPAANHERVGVLLVIGNNEAPSPAMRESVAWLRSALISGSLPGWPALPGAHDLHGHRQMPGANTRCCGDHAINMIARGAFNPGSVSRDDDRPGPTSSREVERIQRILKGAGFYAGTIDGIRGPVTVGAIKAYQAGQNWPKLVADGVWGPKTEAHAMWTGELQSALNRWSQRWDRRLPLLRIDLDYGDLTQARVRDWQVRNHGKAYPRKAPLDGEAGWLTVAGLGMRRHP